MIYPEQTYLQTETERLNVQKTLSATWWGNSKTSYI